MDTAQSKADLLARIDEEAAIWEALLAAVGEDRMEEPGATGPWSFKDVMAHLIGWRRRTLARLTAARDGTPEPPPPWPADLAGVEEDDPDPINDWIYQANRDRALADVLAESRRQFQQMRELVAALPEDALTEPGRYPWMEGYPLGATLEFSFGHLHEEHEPTLRAWLQARND